MRISKTAVATLAIFGMFAQATAQPVQEWVRRYSNTLNNIDEALAVLVDASGDIVAAGYSRGSGDDIMLVKYTPLGLTVWERRFTSSGANTDRALAITQDQASNIYVCGFITTTATGRDFVTQKYSPSGSLLWSRTYTSAGNNVDEAKAIAVDASGNVYVTGNSGADIAVVKYDPDGTLQWDRRFNGGAAGDSAGTGIAVTPEGDVVVAGYVHRPATARDYVVRKYNAAGAAQWTQYYDGPTSGWDSCHALALDTSGNIYVTGGSDSNSGEDYATLKYSPAGSLIWTARYNGPGDGSDRAAALTVDPMGDVYVTGRSEGSGTAHDFATIKYGTDGNTVWIARYDHEAGLDHATAIVADGLGGVVVTGRSQGAETAEDAATIFYDPSGAVIAIRRYHGPGNNNDGAAALALGPANEVYVAGISHGGVRSEDMLLIKYRMEPQTGDLYLFGHNPNGQLGDGTQVGKSLPVLSSLADITAMAGGGHTLALDKFGTIWFAGANSNGQSGLGSTTPVRYVNFIAGPTGFSSVASGWTSCLGIKPDGTLWLWGQNLGQIGNGLSSGSQTVPYHPTSQTMIAAAHSADSHTVAVRQNGSVWTWGDGTFGKLGHGSTTNFFSPTFVSGVGNAIGGSAGGSHTLVLRSDGTVWAFGLNSSGQLGDGSTTQRNSPVQTQVLTNVIQIQAGTSSSYALRSDGTVWAWGLNGNGQLGDGTTINRSSPVQVSGLTEIVAIAAGSNHALALRADGSVYAWGRNDLGQLGDGTATHRTTPVQVLNAAGTGPIQSAFRIASGSDHSMILVERPLPTVSLTLSMPGVSAGGPVTRGLEITIGGSGGSRPPIVLDRDVTFSDLGEANLLLTQADGIPAETGLSLVVAVRDPLHSLRKTVALTASGSQYSASVSLIGGNLNKDNRIDIGDYVVYAVQFSSSLNPNTPFPHLPDLRHADVDGNGTVDTADFSFIATGFGSLGDPPPGMYFAEDRNIRRRITVREAVQESGSMTAAQMDLNRDGWITPEEIEAFLKRHGRR
jgi:uncharacterized delta-60 repeat protein